MYEDIQDIKFIEAYRETAPNRKFISGDELLD
jgi:hypothetical protein